MARIQTKHPNHATSENAIQKNIWINRKKDGHREEWRTRITKHDKVVAITKINEYVGMKNKYELSSEHSTHKRLFARPEMSQNHKWLLWDRPQWTLHYAILNVIGNTQTALLAGKRPNFLGAEANVQDTQVPVDLFKNTNCLVAGKRHNFLGAEANLQDTQVLVELFNTETVLIAQLPWRWGKFARHASASRFI